MIASIQINNYNLSYAEKFWNSVLDFLPKLVLAIGFVLVAWTVIVLVTYILSKLLKVTKLDDITTKLNEAKLFGKSDYTVVPSQIVLKFVKYLLILVFFVIGADILGLTMVSEGIGNFIGYLPILISALAIFVIGVYIASIIQNSIKESFKSMAISGANLIGNIVFYIIVIFVTITALNQAGINTEIITNNLTIILGSILIAITIAFGLGSKDIIARLLLSHYSRRNFEIGQHIKVDTVEGVIEQIDNICVTIKTKDGLVILPIKYFVDQKVEIKSN
jgi:hypothetical protein